MTALSLSHTVGPGSPRSSSTVFLRSFGMFMNITANVSRFFFTCSYGLLSSSFSRPVPLRSSSLKASTASPIIPAMTVAAFFPNTSANPISLEIIITSSVTPFLMRSTSQPWLVSGAALSPSPSFFSDLIIPASRVIEPAVIVESPMTAMFS